jgi:hypothetical protein
VVEQHAATIKDTENKIKSGVLVKIFKFQRIKKKPIKSNYELMQKIVSIFSIFDLLI